MRQLQARFLLKFPSQRPDTGFPDTPTEKRWEMICTFPCARQYPTQVLYPHQCSLETFVDEPTNKDRSLDHDDERSVCWDNLAFFARDPARKEVEAEVHIGQVGLLRKSLIFQGRLLHRGQVQVDDRSEPRAT